MSGTNPSNTPTLLGEALLGAIRQAVREEYQALMGQNGHREGDRLLDAEQTAEILSVSPDWLYRHGSRLPFTRKLGPKMLRFSYQGIQKYLATRKNT